MESFNDKIQGVRHAINSSVPNNKALSLQSSRSNFFRVTLIDDKTLEETILSLMSSTCCLDVLASLNSFEQPGERTIS